MPGIVASTTYEADGQTRQVAYANGVTTTFSYDPERRWLDRVQTANSAGNLILLDYLRDNLGRISSVTSSRAEESWGYGYDSLDRLLVADNLTNSALDQQWSFSVSGDSARRW